MCKGTAFTRDFEPGIASSRYILGLSELLVDSVLVDRGRGEQPTSFCEQQQVAGVCEKPTAPVVIYSYRRTIV